MTPDSIPSPAERAENAHQLARLHPGNRFRLMFGMPLLPLAATSSIPSMTSSPYLAAFDAYHARGEPWTPWTTALDYHLQHGVVISTDRVFLMARRVPSAADDAAHLTLSPPHGTEPLDCWHVWAAAGDLGALLSIAAEFPLPWISWSRRGRLPLTRVRHGQLTETAARQQAAAADLRHGGRPGASGTRPAPA